MMLVMIGGGSRYDLFGFDRRSGLSPVIVQVLLGSTEGLDCLLQLLGSIEVRRKIFVSDNLIGFIVDEYKK
jgi:hypothetical protein